MKPYSVATTFSSVNFSFLKFTFIRMKWTFHDICSSNCILIIDRITYNGQSICGILWKKIWIIKTWGRWGRWNQRCSCAATATTHIFLSFLFPRFLLFISWCIGNG